MATTSTPLAASARVHRLFGEAVLGVPRAAVQVEEHWKRSRAERLIDARHQLAPAPVRRNGSSWTSISNFASGL